MKVVGFLAFFFALLQSAWAIKYMPFGDSITGMAGVCWRKVLYNKLNSAGYDMSQIEFVGSLTSNCGFPAEKNEGHSGFLAIDIANRNQLVDWLRQAGKVDLITMHLGTNDMLSKNVPDILTAFTTLVKQMRDNNPNMKIIVAQIIPLSFSDAKVKELNSKIPAWAAGLTTTNSPITVVDQYTGFSSSDFSDGVHPNASGDQKIADKWYPAFVNNLALLGIYPKGATISPSPKSSPSPSPKSSPSPSPKLTSPSPSPAGNCGKANAQCGGKSFVGNPCCAPGLTCVFKNTWYSQCS